MTYWLDIRWTRRSTDSGPVLLEKSQISLISFFIVECPNKLKGEAVWDRDIAAVDIILSISFVIALSEILGLFEIYYR